MRKERTYGFAGRGLEKVESAKKMKSVESVIDQRNRIHPHKFVLWVGIASIIMMFAGLTSAYIVKSGQPGWQNVETPKAFWYSTLAIVISSVSLQWALVAFKQRSMAKFRSLLMLTLLLGIAFVVLQWIGFNWLWKHGVKFEGAGAGQFLYVIFGLHALHVFGGVVALVVLFIRQYFGSIRTYSSIPYEVMATYWHFVGILWLYLLVFFIWIK